MRKFRQMKSAGQNRRAVAAVEFAIVLPLFILIVFGMIELGRSLMVQQTLAEAARAGCRLYAVQTTSEQQATDVIDTIMDDANITGYSVTFDPSNRSTITDDRVPVTCSVSVPFTNVDWLGAGWFVSSEPLAGICVMPADTGKYEPDEVSAGGDDDE